MFARRIGNLPVGLLSVDRRTGGDERGPRPERIKS